MEKKEKGRGDMRRKDLREVKREGMRRNKKVTKKEYREKEKGCGEIRRLRRKNIEEKRRDAEK